MSLNSLYFETGTAGSGDLRAPKAQAFPNSDFAKYKCHEAPMMFSLTLCPQGHTPWSTKRKSRLLEEGQVQKSDFPDRCAFNRPVIAIITIYYLLSTYCGQAGGWVCYVHYL